MCYRCLCLPEHTHLPKCLSLFCWIVVFYPNRCPICEIKIAFSCLAMVIVRCTVTGNAKYSQQVKVQKICISVRSLLGHLSLCLYDIMPKSCECDRIIQPRLKITSESSMAESLENSSCVCAQTLTQLNHWYSDTNYAQWPCPVSLVALLLLRPITGFYILKSYSGL